MEFVSAVLVSALLIAPASSGNLLFRDVSQWTVDMDWTEVAPGLEVMIRGTYHNTTLIFTTSDPLTLQVVLFASFRGVAGVKGYLPGVGAVSLLEEERVSHLRFVGTSVMVEPGLLMLRDGVLSLRAVGSATVTVGELSETVEVNALLLARLEGGAIVWAKIGVPMGWPFQLPFL